MPLYWFEHPSDPITEVPHLEQFRIWHSRLDGPTLGAIEAEFDRVLDDRSTNGNEVLTSNWLPSELCPDGGQEWYGTPFWPIYETACRQNWQHAGWCFGLLLWDYMMRREEDWLCGKFDKDGVPIGGTTYFRKHR